MKKILLNTNLSSDNKDTFLIDGKFVQKQDVPKFYYDANINFALPKKNECLHYVTNRAFNAIEIIEKIVESGHVIDFAIAIYSIDKKATRKFIDMTQRGDIARDGYFLFSTIRNDRGENLQGNYNQLEQTGLYKIGYYYSHAKVMCLMTAQDFFTVEMSCNLAHNSRCENMTFYNNSELFEFHKNWISKLVDNYKT
jgi:hypothetical protein